MPPFVEKLLRFSLFSLGFLSLAVLCIFICGGCGENSKNGDSKQPVKILFWNTMDGSEAEALQSLTNKFMKENPAIQVVSELVPFYQAQARLIQTAKAGVVPDVFRADRFWIPQFVEANLLEPLDKNFFSAEFEDFLPSAGEVVQKDGKIWGLPHTVDCLALFYNKSHFKEVNARLPEDFDSFKAVAKALTVPDKGRYGFFMNPDGWWFEPFFLGFGGRYFDSTGKISIFSDQALKAMNFLIDLKEAQKAMPPVNLREDSYSLMVRSFKIGQVSMIFNGPWAIRDILSGSAFKDRSENLGIAMLPKGPQGKFAPFGCQSFVIPKGSRHQREAIKFLQFLCSSENLLEFSKKTFGIPARKSLYSDPELKNDPFLGTFILEIRGQTVAQALSKQSRVYEPMGICLKKVLNSDLTPEYALKDLESELK